jgi:spore coat-associated protein N
MVLAGAVLVGVAVAAAPTDANFTATSTSTSNQFTTGTLTLSNDKSTAGQLVSLTDVVPGDTATRTVVITNTGSLGLTYAASVASNTSPNTALWTDTTNGLLVIVRQNDANGTVLYSAGGTVPGPIKDLVLSQSATVSAGGTSTLWMQFSLPSTAGNSFQGLTQSFTITYTATQLTGGAR